MLCCRLLSYVRGTVWEGRVCVGEGGPGGTDVHGEGGFAWGEDAGGRVCIIEGLGGEQSYVRNLSAFPSILLRT